jgi:hypothetical protein
MVAFKPCPEADAVWISARHLHFENSGYIIRSFLDGHKFHFLNQILVKF